MDKTTNFTKLGRLDRAIAENLADIRGNFEDPGLVLDFIVFISQRIKIDLFGYTRFTLKDFCEATGRNRQDLAIKHPLFVNSKKEPPEIEGFRFETVFDYTLVQLMQRNLIFQDVFEDKNEGKVIHLKAMQIVSDVKLNFSRKSKEVKIYDVRVGPEILDGFIRRYYTIDVKAYKLAGKGRGRESRQNLIVYLSVLRHILLSRGLDYTSVPVNLLANQAGVDRRKEPKHLKEAINNILIYVRDKAQFPFDFQFGKLPKKSFYVELTFHKTYPLETLTREHNFYHKLLVELKNIFNYKYGKGIKEVESNTKGVPFQDWLASGVDLNEKISVLKKSYSQAYRIELNDVEAHNIFKNGFEKDPF